MKKRFLKHKKICMFASIFIGILVFGIAIFYKLSYSQTVQESSLSISEADAVDINSVSARGRLKPQGKVIQLSAPTSLEGTRVKKLLVKEGDKVHAGKVIAILDNQNRLLVALKQAKKQVKVAHANLAKIKAGAKVGEIDAQKAKIGRLEAELAGERNIQQARKAHLQAQLNGEINTQQAKISRFKNQLNGEKKTQQATIYRLEAELNNARSELERYQNLYEQGVIEASKFDSKGLDVKITQEKLNEAQANLSQTKLTLQYQINEAQASLKQTEETLQQQINEIEATLIQKKNSLQQQISESKATLQQIIEVRPTDVKAAQAEIENAMAVVEKAQAELDLAYVRVPKNGRILKIYTFPGEVVGQEGIAALGETDNMYVVAEVYETDINQVRPGQKATITSNAFPGKLHGEVAHLGLQIGKQQIFSTDPIADIDRRVVEVKIHLNKKDSQKVKNLTNLQVEVLINI